MEYLPNAVLALLSWFELLFATLWGYFDKIINGDSVDEDDTTAA